VKTERFKPFFEEIYDRYNRKEFIHTDPIDFPHTYEGNKEFIALVASCFAYGNVKAIKSFIKSFLDYYGTDPMNLTEKSGGLYYRFQKKNDVEYFARFMKRIYSEYGSVENIFTKRETLEEGIVHFYELVKKESADNGFFFLFPNPSTSGAKRLRMFLRWMIRDDEIDFGLWKNFSPESLKMPIDTHILRFSNNNGIIDNVSATKKNLEKVTDFFIEMNKEDPAKYDFALTRLGIAGGCKYQKTDVCHKCAHNGNCIFVF
jgi:uncharacterized protein (TIGR02757 family)